MAKSLSFTVPGEPQGKARARATVRNGQPRMYTPDKTVSYERTVGIMAREAGVRPCEGPVTLSIAAHFLTREADVV